MPVGHLRTTSPLAAPDLSSIEKMPAIPKFSTVLYWIFYLVPIYIFIIAPGLRILFSSQNPEAAASSSFQDDFYGHDEFAPRLDGTDEPQAQQDSVPPLDCPEDPYRVHILSRSPLIIYVENFFSDSEIDHLLAASANKYEISSIYDGNTERVDPSIRRSDRALLERDHVVQCLEERARSFQGWRPHLHIERLWTQRYNISGHYRHHFDWTGNRVSGGGDRVSTFMVYLDANCTGGGTNFPRLRRPRGAKWCRFIECNNEDARDSNNDKKKDLPKGITFKPIRGNAIFWENLRPDGTGYMETWHAALPVLSGTKVGLNIWSWYQPPTRK